MIGMLKDTLLQIEHTWQRSISGIVVSGCWWFNGPSGYRRESFRSKSRQGSHGCGLFFGERDKNLMAKLRDLFVNMAMVQRTFVQCLTNLWLSSVNAGVVTTEHISLSCCISMPMWNVGDPWLSLQGRRNSIPFKFAHSSVAKSRHYPFWPTWQVEVRQPSNLSSICATSPPNKRVSDPVDIWKKAQRGGIVSMDWCIDIGAPSTRDSCFVVRPHLPLPLFEPCSNIKATSMMVIASTLPMHWTRSSKLGTT